MSRLVRESEKTDAILLSKHFVFTKDWLKYIGNNREKQVTRQQFETWKRNIDRLYEHFEGFTGYKPRTVSDRIIVDLMSREIGRNIYGVAHAHEHAICFNPYYVGNGSDDYLLKDIRSGMVSGVMMHEMGHLFHMGGWAAESETAADFLKAFAIEAGGFSDGTTRGDQFRREHRLRSAIDKMRDNRAPFIIGNDTKYSLYMYGIVDVVGWNTLSKTIQSYNKGNNTFIPTKKYLVDSSGSISDRMASHRTARAHEFFDRVAYFHDERREAGKKDPRVLQTIPPAGRNLTGAQALRSLPDKGKLLDEHFTAKTNPIKRKPVQDIQQASATQPRNVIARIVTPPSPAPQNNVVAPPPPENTPRVTQADPPPRITTPTVPPPAISEPVAEESVSEKPKSVSPFALLFLFAFFAGTVWALYKVLSPVLRGEASR